MRGFECYYYHDEKLKKQNKNTSCWRGLDKTTAQYIDSEFIYIDRFDDPLTEKYQSLLIKIINEITSCELLQIEKRKIIKYKVLSNYRQNLLLLNFIRNLWNTPRQSYSETEPIYTKVFFETLEKTELTDPFEKLTFANKEACTKAGYSVRVGHSNVEIPKNLKVKNTESFIKYGKIPYTSIWSGQTTDMFLTTNS